jgi:tryptophan-rich sensory protein
MRVGGKTDWRVGAWSALLTCIVAGLGAAATPLDTWYRALAQPAWKPPDWAFGPAWTLIFALAAWSAARAYTDTLRREQRRLVIVLYLLNGALNVLWSLLFFTLRRPDWALAEVLLLWLSIVWIMRTVRQWSPMAFHLLWPYLAWVSFAATINFGVVRLNGPFH